MVVIGTIKGNGSGVIKPVTRFKANFIMLNKGEWMVREARIS